ncbi:hypothetical protein ACQ86N_39075 [Puia sp. P3]|uniref:hypothetical protein n=1 Tax=Puia sp. P3 TaxID=3423952 RepID=UPI003D665C86
MEPCSSPPLLSLGTATTSLSPHPKPIPTPTNTRLAAYYWFLVPGDVFNDYASLADEINEWWWFYDGVLINTSPMGGTLIARGYINGNIPHTGFPLVNLYAHFTY